MTEVTHFFNPNHDARGRFTSGPSVGRFFTRNAGKHSGPAAPYSPKFDKADRLRAQQQLLADASKLREGLTPGEKTALLDYTDTFQGSQAINHALQGRAKKEWDSGKPQTTKFQGQTTLKSVQEFERVFDKTPVNSTPLQLIRGIGEVGRSWGRPGDLEGKTMSAEGLTSTSMDVSYATYAAKTTARMKGNEGGSVLMVMHVPAGTVRALPVSDILHANRKTSVELGAPPPPGHEVILPPGTKIKVHNDVRMTPDMQLPGGEVFYRMLRVEVLPEDPDYRQNFSIRDNLSLALDGVSLFFNPNHDPSTGRFTSGPGGKGRRGKFKKAGKPKNKAEQELDDLIASIRKKNEGLKHLKPIHEHFSIRKDMTSDQIAAAFFYEGSFQRSGAINDIFRFGRIREKNLTDETRDEKQIRKHAEDLKAVFDTAPRLSKPTVVHRAVRNMPGDTDPKQIAAMEVERQRAQDKFDFTGMSYWDDKISAARKGGSLTGKVLKDEGFMSTTADERTAKGYMNYSAPGEKPAMLKLTAPAGTPVVAINSILEKDGGPQAELLLRPGTAYKVISDTIVDGARVITGEILPVSRETSLSGEALLPIVSLYGI